MAGQDNAVELSKVGFNQALDLISRIEEIRPVKIYSSPLIRCLQTIAPYIQKYPKTKFEVSDSLIEMDYGSWSGKKLDDLRKQSAWNRVQKKPSSFTFPKGESFKSLRLRLDYLLADLVKDKGPILFVTHGDVIKMALALVVGVKIDNFQKFVVEPGSISIIALDPENSSILASNTLNFRSIGKYWRRSQLGGGDFLKSRSLRKK